MKTILILTASVLAIATAASAGPNNGNGNGGGNGKGGGHGGRNASHAGNGGWAVNNGMATNPGGKLMKAPPGQVKKMNRQYGLGLGNVLSSGYPGYRVLNDTGRYNLAAAPAGYEYVRVGNDAYLRQSNTGVISNVIQNLFR